MSALKTFACSIAALLVLVGLEGFHPHSSRVQVPGIVLWAWERPENLNFIDPSKVAVAFLSRTIELADSQVTIRPRHQPLQVPPGTTMIAVTRLTTTNQSASAITGEQESRIVAAVLQSSRSENVRGVQIDFDAKQSERSFYRSLLTKLRSQLPDSISLSITALSSWCLYDNWMSDLPIDDAVPMLFRLGPDRIQVIDHLKDGKDFSSPICRQSVGVSLDEPFPSFNKDRRIYIFNPRSWSNKNFQSSMKELGR